MELANKPLVLLNGVPHDLEMLRRHAGSAPTISVKLTDLNDSAASQNQVALHKAQPANADQAPLFFKQDGKFTVLYGQAAVQRSRDSAADAVVGKLISTPVLKKCRLHEERPEPAEPPRALERVYRRDSDYRGNRMEFPERSDYDGRQSFGRSR